MCLYDTHAGRICFARCDSLRLMIQALDRCDNNPQAAYDILQADPDAFTIDVARRGRRNGDQDG